MGLTMNQLQMIRALAENRVQDAKKYAICCCVEDNTKKNEHDTRRYKNMLENGGAQFMELPSNLTGCLRMEDVSGFNERRYYLGETEEKTFQNISRTSRANLRLMELGIPYLNSTLLYGDPGTGKTMFGKYVAYKLGLPFAYVNFSFLIDSYMGNTSKNIKRVFDFCKGKPCVLMLDEIDCIGLKRGGGDKGVDGELGRTTISLMQEMDFLSNDMVVIAATNREDRLDPALKRRFYQKIKFEPYDESERVAMAVFFLDDVGIPYDSNEIKEYAKEKRTQADMIKFASQIVIRKVLEEEKGEVFHLPRSR